MKKVLLQIIILGIYGSQNISNAQGGSPGNIRALPTQFLGWNTAGVAGPLDIRNDFNDRINFFGTNIQRMFINGGINNAQNTGRVAMSNDMGGFAAVDRLNLFENFASATPTGSVQIRFQNTFTGIGSANGYAIGVSNSNLIPNDRVVNHTQFENRPMRWLSPDSRASGAITEWMRIQNGTTGSLNALSSSDGYIGLNNNAPTFHIDAITPAFAGQELFASFQTSDVANSRMGLCNGGIGNTIFAPTFFGSIGSTQVTCALQTLGIITTAQDAAANSLAVTQFRTGRDWVPNSGSGIEDIDSVINRYAFSWVNGTITKMFMNASGQVRIGNRLIGGTGINATPPGNRLEISAGANDPYGNVIATNGASGLRLTHLTSAKTTVVNPGTGVLAVDSVGNVIYVPKDTDADNGLSTNGPTAGKIHLGQNVGALGDPGKLLNNREIPYNGQNIYFTGQDTVTTAAIYMGYSGNDIDQGKLNVKTLATNLGITTAAVKGINRSFYGGTGPQNREAIGVYGISDTLQTNTRVRNIGVKGIAEEWYPIGVYGLVQNNSSGVDAFGVMGEAICATTNNTAGKFSARVGTGNNYGVIADAKDGVFCVGVNGAAIGSDYAYGGRFVASGGSVQNIGVYADGGGSPTPGPVLPAQLNLAGYFNGDVFIAGAFGPSDQNLKQNIDSIPGALSIINQLKPKTFDYKHSSYPSMNLPRGKQYGLIAQDVEPILPELVSNNTHPAKLDSAGNVIIPAVNFKGLKYEQLIPLLIKALQEQQAKIDSLTSSANSKDSIQDARLTALENAIAQCCSNNNAKTSNNSTQHPGSQLDVELSDKDAIVLNQNVPNPFAEQTTISYNVPPSVGKAQLLFYNSNGQLIQSVEIKTRGKGKVNVFASDLSSGLYHYTLVADGKVVDSKKMVRE